ncbi:MAG: tetratricopeptide repeat protein [Deltaproteobacteria bacterium]|nr:tetratricopeptide repeat protein [Deltaproteobacteria bacterium]
MTKQNRQLTLLIIFLLAMPITALYWQVQNHEFVDYDDQLYVTENYRIQSGLTLEGIRSAFTDISTSNWHPVTTLSHLMDWHYYKANAGGHHWSSVVLHIFNTILLFLFLNILTGATGRSAFIAALFAVHPINVESVAWIAERKNVLSTFFWLLTMLFYVRYAKLPHWKRYLPVIFCFALGLMSKPMLVTVPFVLLLLDYWPLNRTAISMQGEQRGIDSKTLLKKQKLTFLILEKVPLFILSVISIVMTIYASKTASRAMVGLESFSLIDRISNAIVAYALYVKKLFWPVDLALFYPLFNHPPWEIILAALFLMIITFGVCLYYKRYPYLPVGWFWYLGTLVPVIGIVQVGDQAMADRYAYVPFIGLFIMMTWGAYQVAVKIKYGHTMILFISVFLIWVFSLSTYRQIETWHDTVTVFENSADINPRNYLAYNILGKDADKKGNYRLALSYYLKALKIPRSVDETYSNMGTTLIKMNRRAEAYKCFETSLRINSNSAEANYNLGLFYMEDNRLDLSINHFRKAIENKPYFIDAYNNLGIALVKKGRIQEGIMNFEKALTLNPNHQIAQKNIGIARALMKKNN